MLSFKKFFLNKVLSEALDLQQAKSLKTTRRKSGAYKIPQINEVFGSKDRLIYDFDVDYLKDFNKTTNSSDSSYNKISNFLIKLGFKKPAVDDYIQGIAYKENDKNVFKIGRILTANEDNQPKIMNNKDNMVPEYTARFKNDPIRHIKNPKLVIVISRHPYDIYGMSTNRMWTSCMDLKKTSEDAELGNTSFIPKEVEKGTLIAYLTPKTELNSFGKVSLKKPVSRVLLKPMYNDSQELGYALSKTYGGIVDRFNEFLINWMDINFNDKIKDNTGFALATGVYEDPYEPGKLVEASPQKKEIRILNSKLEDIKNEMFSLIPNDIRSNVIINSFVDDDMSVSMTIIFNFKFDGMGKPYKLTPEELPNHRDIMNNYNVHWKLPDSEYFKGVFVNPTLKNIKFTFYKVGNISDIEKLGFWILQLPAQTLGQ